MRILVKNEINLTLASELSITGGDSGAAFGGDTVTLTCTETNTVSPDGTYKWYLSDSEISGATSQTYEINPDSQDKAGTYNCEATFSTTVEQSPDLIFALYGRERPFHVFFIY